MSTDPNYSMQELQIYYINLDRSTERRAFMERQFERLGLSVERIAAIDGRSLDAAQEAETSLTDGELGCFMSHRLAWRALVNSGRSYAVILEDDVNLSHNFSTVVASSQWIPDGADIVKLETMKRKVGISTTMRPMPGGHTSRLLTRDVGGGGYLIHRREAIRLLSEESMLRAVDLVLFSTRAVRTQAIYQAVPAMVLQSQHTPSILESTLKEARCNVKKARPRPPLLKRIPREIRRIWWKLGNPAMLYLLHLGRVRFIEINFCDSFDSTAPRQRGVRTFTP